MGPLASKWQSLYLRGLTLEGNQLCKTLVPFNSPGCLSQLRNYMLEIYRSFRKEEFSVYLN